MKIRCAMFVALVAILGIGATVAFADTETAEPHPFSVHDMLAMERLGSPVVSPDGAWAAFTVRSTDLESNGGLTDIWLVSTDGKTTKRLTSHEAADWNPAWCLNGHLFFLSSRGGSSQIWQIDPTGGEAVAMTDLPLDIGSFMVVPDLRSFLLTLEVYPGLGVQGTLDRDAELADDPTTGMAYDELMFRHWDTWEDGKRSHLFMLAAGSNDPVDLMPDLDTDVPTRPWGGLEEVAVTPDADEVVFTAKVLP